MTIQSPLFRLALGALMGTWIGTPLYAVETELKDDGGKAVIRYVVEPPEGIAAAGVTDPAKKVGLILCFPEHDRPTGDEILPVREALKRLGIRDNYVLLAGHPQGRKFGSADDEPIAKLIAWAKQTYPVNPRRVYMYGKGEGGKISGEFAMLHPDIVTAGITYSWGWWRMPSELSEAIDPLNSAPEFYMVLGLRDLSYHLTTVRDTYSRVSAKGYRVIYREFEDLGARTYHPPSNGDAIAWATRLRNKNLPLSMEERRLLKQFASGTPPSANADGYFTALALVGGAPAGAVVEKLLESGSADVRAAAAETFSHAIFNEPAVAALAKKATDPSAKVRGAAIRALAINANWRSEKAQQALIELATRPGNAVDARDRIDAVDGIVQAVRFQVKGVRQDPPLFQALIGLLDDKDEELRVMAANTLAPVRDRGYRGDLGRPEQKTPEGGWANWLNEISAKAAGYSKDYEVCGSGNTGSNRGSKDPVDLYCVGGENLHKNPAMAFQYTLQAAEKGYVPAEAAVGMMYANGKGAQQNYAEAAKWWTKAAEGGHVLAASNASMVYRGVAGVEPDPAQSEKWAKFAAEHGAGR
ncbi:MAG: HEAT repeat domain-containing protein [Bryobacteraceae bacterium]